MKFKAHLSDLNLSNLLANTTIKLKESKTNSIHEQFLLDLSKKSDDLGKNEESLSLRIDKSDLVEVVEQNCGLRPHFQK